MINNVTYPLQSQPFLAERYLAISLLLHEAITYPLDHITTRTISKLSNVSGNSLFSYKEQYIIAQQIYKKNKLYHGLFSGFDKCLFKNVSIYFTFQWLYFKYLYKPIVSQDYVEDYSTPYSPEHNIIYPLLKYIDYLDPLTHLIIALSTSLGTIITQPAHIVKIKAQNESLDYQFKLSSTDRFKQIIKQKNKSLLTMGLTSRLTYNFFTFLIEGSLFQYYLHQTGFQFMNLYEPSNETPSLTLTKGLQLGLISSLVSTTLLYPLLVYNYHEVLQGLGIQKQNFKLDVSILSKGYLTYASKKTTRHLTVLGVLWYTATQKNKERMME